MQISDSALARVHIIVRTAESVQPRISIREIEERIGEFVITWSDRLHQQLLEEFGHDEGHSLFKAFGQVFPAGYQDDTPPSEACSDIRRMENMIVCKL